MRQSVFKRQRIFSDWWLKESVRRQKDSESVAVSTKIPPQIDKPQCAQKLHLYSDHNANHWSGGSIVQDQKIHFKLETAEGEVSNGERFLSNIRLFLAFKKAAGENTTRQEFLLDELAEMQRRLYGQRAAREAVRIPHVPRSFGQQIEGI
jgi:hypothetical protein